MQQVKPTTGGAMPGTAIPGASVSICLPMARGTHLREASPTAGAPAQHLGLKHHLNQPRERKEWCTPPQDPPAGIFQRKRCSWQGRGAETAQLAPRTASCLCSHPVPRPGHPADTRLCTWHTPLHSHQTPTLPQSSRHSEITINHLYQRSWC